MIKGTLQIDAPAGARLKEIAAQLANPVALYKDTGRRVTEDLRKHFKDLDAKQPNVLGGKRTHFWLDVRNATQNPVVDPAGATVTIAHLAFAQKLFGGPLVPKNANWLTIPIDPRAHGRRVSVFEQETGIKLFRPRGLKILAYSEHGKLVPVYALSKHIDQDPEPLALPPAAQLSAGVMDTAEKHLARTLNNQ